MKIGASASCCFCVRAQRRSATANAFQYYSLFRSPSLSLSVSFVSFSVRLSRQSDCIVRLNDSNYAVFVVGAAAHHIEAEEKTGQRRRDKSLKTYTSNRTL